MKSNYLLSRFCFLCTISFLILPLTEQKAFGGGRGGSFKASSKGSGSFSGASSYSRSNSYKPNIGPVRKGSSFKSKAVGVAAGAAGGIAAYSLMQSISGSYRSRSSNQYGPEYEIGETCFNNEDMNGTVFGQFRCPLYGFSINAKHCCGEYGQQYCCTRQAERNYGLRGWQIGLIILAIFISTIVCMLLVRYCRRSEKDVIMVPSEPPQAGQNFGSPLGYPPSSHNDNPYASPLSMPYLAQQQMSNSY